MSNNRKPTHRLFIVTGEGDKTNWTEIGAAWANRDGEGFSLNLSAIPLTGRIAMRAISEKSASEGSRQ